MKEILVVGAGLSGLIAAHLIKLNTDANVTIIEKGNLYEERLCSDSPDMLCGIGGAGTVGGGKLCFPPASSAIWKKTYFSEESFFDFIQNCLSPFCKKISRQQSTLKHISRLVNVNEGIYKKDYFSVLLSKEEMNCLVSNIVTILLDTGTQIKTNCELKSVEIDDEAFIANYSHRGESVRQKFDVVLLASGRSSASTICSLLPSEIKIKNRCPDLGLRFSFGLSDEHVFHSIGNDVKFKSNINNIGVRTFCVCSGGEESLISTDAFKYYDGHFGSEMTNKVNLGLLARSKKLAGCEYAEMYCNYLKKYIASDMSLNDFVKRWNTLIPETPIFDEVLYALSVFIKRLQANRFIPENLDLCPMYFPSVDNLNPLIKTNRHFETDCPNLYVIGDACGISRGFVQSMWSAHCACLNIVWKLNHTINKTWRLQAI